jgi:hypothetical protein
MTMRAVRPLVVAVFCIVAGAGAAPDNPDLLAAEPASLVLNLHFTSTDGLPAASRRALMAEVESIWKLGHIRLKWLRESTEADEGDTLRVLVIARPVATSAHAPWTVGELLRSEGFRPVAIASTIGARRIIDESEWDQLLAPAALHDYRLGVVLGRAVAHEIGHYMLRTNTHATRGLMRARIGSREFADLRSGSFRLDQAAEAYLAALAATGTSLERVTFSYPSP